MIERQVSLVAFFFSLVSRGQSLFFLRSPWQWLGNALVSPVGPRPAVCGVFDGKKVAFGRTARFWSPLEVFSSSRDWKAVSSGREQKAAYSRGRHSWKNKQNWEWQIFKLGEGTMKNDLQILFYGTRLLSIQILVILNCRVHKLLYHFCNQKGL